LTFGDHTYDIIGVAPPQFFGVEVGKIIDIWTPVSMASAADLDNDHTFWLRTMGRLKPGVTTAQAAAPLQSVINQFMLEDVRLHAPPGTPKDVIDRFLAGTRIKGVPAGGGISSLRRQYEQPLKIVMGVVGLVMLIACSSVANILIARGSARRQEIAIRLALGAGRGRIFQQFLMESSLLATVSAVCGVLLAYGVTPLLIGLLTPTSDPAALITTMDVRLLAFTSFLTLVTVVFYGLFPAIRLAKLDMNASLKGGLRLTEGAGAQARKFILVAQIALSLALVIGAGLFTRTLVNLMSSYTGFRPQGVLVARLTLPHQGNGTSPFYAWHKLIQAVRSFPAVEHASLSSSALFDGEPQLMGIRTNAAESQPADPVTGLSFVSTDYFSTLGMKVTSGRDFQTIDERLPGAAVAIVNQAFAGKFFAHGDPIGQKITKMANDPLWTEIVGVVEDVKVNSLRNAPPPMIYVPFGQISDWLPPQAGLSLFLQVSGRQNLRALSAELRRRLPSSFVVEGIFRQQQLINDTLVRERLLANVANVFGVLAFVLATAGLYGIMSYLVAQRRQELGIRMAMGAEPSSIMTLVIKESTRVVVPGIILGLIASRLASSWVRTWLYGLAPDDAGTFLAASICLIAGLLGAAVIPAFRAAKENPMIALRKE
jgi:predicted permease